MKVLAELPPRDSPGLRMGTLRRRDQMAFAQLLSRLNGSRAVLVTGGRLEKRTAAAGLASAAAAAGIRTVLLECDLVEPGLADALGLALAPGLREFLLGEADAERILRPVALAGPGSAAATEPLVCVVAGRAASDAPALLASGRFGETLTGLRSAYDLVVVDGPPAFGSDGALTMATAQVDATLLCVPSRDQVPVLPVAVTGLVVQG